MRVTVPYTTDTGDDINLICIVTKGHPAVMYQRNGDPGWPADSAEVEIVGIEGSNDSVPGEVFNRDYETIRETALEIADDEV